MRSDLIDMDNRGSEKSRLEFQLSLVAVLVGLALRSWQYFADTSLFLDEIALARNISDLSWSALLFSPLDYDQIAPPGFLALVKLTITALGTSDMAFRLIPFLSSIAGMLVFYLIAARLPGHSGLAALVLFALSPGLINTSLLVKPYGNDILVTLLLIWLAMNLLGKSGYKIAWPALAVAGIVSVWFSYPAVFTLGAIALTLLAFSFLRQGTPMGSTTLLIVLASWLISVMAALAFSKSLLEPQTFAYFNAHWAPGFTPLNEGMWNSLLWLAKRIHEMFAMVVSGGVGGPISAFYLMAGAMGALIVWTRRPRVALLLYLQIILALIAAMAGFYPLLERVALFLLPSLIILAALCLEGLNRLLPKKSTWLPALLTVVFVLPSIYSFGKNPIVYRTQEMKPLLAYMQQRRQDGDQIYIYYGAAQAMMLYGHRFGFKPDEYLIGGCHRGEIRLYLKEIDRFRGQPRTWMVFSHAAKKSKEKLAILSYLSTIGTQKETKSFTGCSAHLFDLSDETKLSAASAASHEFTPGADADLAWGCGHGPHVSRFPRQR